MARQPAASSNFSIPPLITFLIAVAVLYFARQLLIPFALAILFAFLLSPIVKRFENLHVPRIPAVLFVLLVAAGIIGGVGWIVSVQLVDIVNDLPRYRENIHRKMTAVQTPGTVARLYQSIEDLGKDLSATQAAQPVAGVPQKVEVVAAAPTGFESIRNVLGPLLGPLETGGIVVVFTIFMLIDREDLRNRLLGLVGQRQLHRTTKALDDAAQRVSRYLLLQFLVNAVFGAVIGLALLVLGVNSYLLWGVLAMLLRFVPYVGVVIAGVLPFSVAFATMDGWRGPVLVLAVFFAVELITGNLVEPMLYGAHTGLSAVAILTAVVFWTALWGPIGLILSMPLTLCLSVLGRYSPQLQFLNVLLGDEPVLSPDALFYQRLLALDQHDALVQVETFLKDKTLVEVYDQVVVPALMMAERDRHAGQLDAQREEFLIQSINEIVTELADSGSAKRGRGKDRVLPLEAAPPTPNARKENRVFSLSAHDTADEIAAAMFAQLAEREGFPALSFPVLESPAEFLQSLDLQAGDFVCISAVPPLALTHARRVGQEIRDAFPGVALVLGLWCYPSTASSTIERLQQTTGSHVETALAGALARLCAEPPVTPDSPAN
jgi:predicted PurR-regulated permease PerM